MGWFDGFIIEMQNNTKWNQILKKKTLVPTFFSKIENTGNLSDKTLSFFYNKIY